MFPELLEQAPGNSPELYMVSGAVNVEILELVPAQFVPNSLGTGARPLGSILVVWSRAVRIFPFEIRAEISGGSNPAKLFLQGGLLVGSARVEPFVFLVMVSVPVQPLF